MFISRMFFRFIFLMLFSQLLFVSYSYSVESNDIKSLNKCVTCHGLSGNSVVTMWPKIAGQHSDYMLKQLLEFKKGKDGTRFDPTMFGMLQNVEESELEKLADYYSNQVLDKSKLQMDNNLFEEGKNIYLYGDRKNEIPACVSCHGEDGMGNKLAKYPVLKWQHKEYLCIQMNKFKTSERSNDLNGIMRDISSKMSKEQIEAVSFYISLID